MATRERCLEHCSTYSLFELAYFEESLTFYIGLQILPALLPPEIQVHLLDRLLHRDLTNPQHKTNVHLHYDVQYPATNESFFSMAPTSDERFLDHDKTRPPMSIQSFLCKKLRWCTLGGQYDWTAKRYPDEPSPPFPSDTAELIHGLFPETRAQAAIVNLYTPGDTLSIHRDVSEECGTGLVSISIGCDAIFIAALEDEKFQNGVKHVAVRLRSGDAVYMAGPARFAWHGVPRILEGTCPDWLKDWPAPGFEAWRGWMGSKRINVNIRQMHQSREL